MTKRIIAILFALVLVFSVAALPASAGVTSQPRLDDRADLLTPSEEDLLNTALINLSNQLNADIVFVTSPDLNASDFPHNHTSRDYADMYYESKGYDKDGILVLVTLSNENGKREVYFSTSGKCIKRLSDSEREAILDDVIANHNPDSKSYYEFLYAIALDLQKAVPPHLKWYMLPLALLIGFALAMIILMSQRAKLKTVKSERGAANYVRQGSMNLTASRDTYLYSTVTRTARPKNEGSSTHSSSGGGTHGGGGRTF